jgi:hypothetical protein
VELNSKLICLWSNNSVSNDGDILHLLQIESRISEMRKKSILDLLLLPVLGTNEKSILLKCRALKGSVNLNCSQRSDSHPDLIILGGLDMLKISILSFTPPVLNVVFQSPPHIIGMVLFS